MGSFFSIQIFFLIFFSFSAKALTPCFIATWAETTLNAQSTCSMQVSFKTDDLKKFNDETQKICEDGCGNMIAPVFLSQEDKDKYDAKLKVCPDRYFKIMSKYQTQINMFADKNECSIKWDKLGLEEDHSGKNHYKVDNYTCSNGKEYDAIRENQVGWSHQWNLNAICNKGILKKRIYLSEEYQSDDIKKCQSETTPETAFCYFEYTELNEIKGDGDMPNLVQAKDFYYGEDTNCKKRKESFEKVISKVDSYKLRQKKGSKSYTVAENARNIALKSFGNLVDYCNDLNKEIPMKSKVIKN